MAAAGQSRSKPFSNKAIMGVVGMMTFGTGTMISSKLMLDTSAEGACMPGPVPLAPRPSCLGSVLF
jgi:hypothetical protein